MRSSLLSIRSFAVTLAFGPMLIAAGCGGGSSSVPSGSGEPVTVNLSASPQTINAGQMATLTWTATNATSAMIDNGVGSVDPAGGSVTVTPQQTTTYTITGTGRVGQQATAQTTVSVNAVSLNSINHVIFMLQENRSFDTYFGMLNPYRQSNGFNVGDDGMTFTVDGIDDKLSQISNEDDEGQSFMLFKTRSSCLEDMTSAWLESYGDVSRYNFTLDRHILMDGFVHIAEGYAKIGGGGDTYTDLVGRRAMAYYDQGFLPYYYFMASQFAISDRWFSPVSSKSTPNRIATYTGGTTQGLVRDPFVDDHLGTQLPIPTIFEELDQHGVSWKIYYSLTAGGCTEQDGDCGQGPHSSDYPVTTFSDFSYSAQFLYENPQHQPCTAPTIGSMQAVGDPTDAFCIDINHIAPLSHYMSDVQSNTLPNFAYIEAAYGHGDEHPGSGQSILQGQQVVAGIINALMQSTSWSSSVFFLSYDEAGGPYDHVPPVPHHSNDFSDSNLTAPDISSIAVNADNFKPCLPPGGMPTLHCDLQPTDPGANPNDAPAQQGFAAQLGFRVPNLVVSPFARKHYVGHFPMDHTAILKLVETRFIGGGVHLTPRVAAQPDLMDMFDFVRTPWVTPPAPPPAPAPYACTPDQM
jgi:phospholipase C